MKAIWTIRPLSIFHEPSAIIGRFSDNANQGTIISNELIHIGLLTHEYI